MRFTACTYKVSFDSQRIAEAILAALDDAMKSERRELSEALQALLAQDLTEAEKAFLLAQILESKERYKAIRKSYRKAKKQVNDFYKQYWLRRISFAERSNGSPDITLKMIATLPTDNDYMDDCYRWGGTANDLSV